MRKALRFSTLSLSLANSLQENLTKMSISLNVFVQYRQIVVEVVYYTYASESEAFSGKQAFYPGLLHGIKSIGLNILSTITLLLYSSHVNP